jgi:SAM-dependent methyltransferase
MKESVLERLRCAECAAHPLNWDAFRSAADGTILDGVVWCGVCHSWFPVEDALLEHLPGPLAYAEDRARFWRRHEHRLSGLGLRPFVPAADASAVQDQQKQQEHFDWYADNDKQTYHDFEEMPFWQAVTAFDLDRWRHEIRPGSSLLDVGCAQGRTTFKLMDLPIQIVGFDVSKLSIRQAIARYRAGGHRAEGVFFVGDATRIPFVSRSFDHALLYGVLHHLPDPGAVCRQLADVLRPGGVYYGTENNKTALRPAFELLQKVLPIWHEEAGNQPLISHQDLCQWFDGTGVEVDTRTHVFVPPHLVNLLGRRVGDAVLHASDWCGQRLPFVRRNGGLIMIRARRAA